MMHSQIPDRHADGSLPYSYESSLTESPESWEEFESPRDRPEYSHNDHDPVNIVSRRDSDFTSSDSVDYEKRPHTDIKRSDTLDTTDSIDFEKSPRTGVERSDTLESGDTQISDVGHGPARSFGTTFKRLTSSSYIFAWIAFVIATLSFALTIAYAARSLTLSNFHEVRSSSSRTIFILRLLSGLTEVLMGILVSISIEKIQWLLVSRVHGETFSTFLSLSAGTGYVGLFKLLVSPGRTSLSSRLFSLGRLLLAAGILVTGILIMSDVTTRVTSYPRESFVLNSNIGFQLFNSSTSNMSSVSGSTMFDYAAGDFLADDRYAVDITSSVSGSSNASNEPYNRVMFMPTGLSLVPQDALNSDPDADMAIVENANGFRLDFTPVASEFSFTSEDCKVFGAGIIEVQLCLKNDGNSLAASLNSCNGMASVGDHPCMTNASDWTQSGGWATNLTLSYQPATVGYSISNRTILTYDLSSPSTPTLVTPDNIMNTFELVFGMQGVSEILSLCGIITNGGSGSSGSFWSPTLWAFLIDELETMSGGGLEGKANGFAALQSILAIPIFFFSHPTINSTASTSSSGGAISPSVSSNSSNPILGVSSSATYTRVTLASSAYQLVVGRSITIAYTILGAIVLLLCLLCLAAASFTRASERIPRLSPFEMYNVLRLTRPLLSEELQDDGGAEWPEKWSMVKHRMQMV